MVEQRSRFRSDPDFENDTGRRVRPYAFGRSARADVDADSAPIFLSEQEEDFLADQDGEPDQWESASPLRKQRSSVSLRILIGVLAASAVAMLFALFTSDAMRDVFDSAKASVASVLPVPSANAQPETTQLTARDIQLKDPTRLAPPVSRTTSASNQVANQVAMASPSREDIQNAYQSALRGPVGAPALPTAPPTVSVPPPAAQPPVVSAPPAPAVAVVPPAVVGPMALPSPTPPAARRMDPDELASLMTRAKGLLASGDIAPARLLLERAADAQEPGAAFLLAQSYDPDVLKASNARSITPDVESARTWYQKAAQLGSVDAQRRLAQLQN